MKKNLDFVVIGAQKAGTTSLFEYLRRHPEVWIPPSKEAWYFSHDSIYARGWDDYLTTYFGRADSRCKWGTVTPSYMAGGVYAPAAEGSAASPIKYDERTVPERIGKLLPTTKLVAILRDPVARAHSHHRMQVMNGSESRPFAAAAYELLSPSQLRQSHRFPEETNAYISWGEYGRILSAYLDYFHREQILILFTDELDRSPIGLLRRLYEFLDVDSAFVPDNVGDRYRIGATERRVSWVRIPQARRAVAQYEGAKTLWYRLPDRGRQALDSAYESIAYRVDLWNRRPGVQVKQGDRRVDQQLREHFLPDAELLYKQFDVVPPWLAAWDRNDV